MEQEFWTLQDDGKQDKKDKGMFRPVWGIMPAIVRNEIDYGKEEIERIQKKCGGIIVKVKLIVV